MTLDSSNFKIHTFNSEVNGQSYCYRVLKMDQQLLIYVGEENNDLFDELAVGFGYVSSTILGSSVLGNGSDQLAQKLAKRLDKQVYMSCNVTEDQLSRPLIEKHLVDEIKKHPEFF